MQTRPRVLESSASSWEAWRSEFPIFTHTTYLNTCSLAALSKRVTGAVREYLDLWERDGASAWYGPWWEMIGTLRDRTAAVLGASPDEIALFPSVTAALSAVASALDLGRRPRVVMSSLEFPTTRYQWVTKRDIVPVTVESPDGLTVPLERYEAAVDEQTALVVGSHVYFTSGLVQNIAQLAAIAHQRGALCLVDAYQSVGQLPLDVRAAGVDFLVGGGLKWLLGGSGIAFLYVRRELIHRLEPQVVGWFAHRDQFAFAAEFSYAGDARRFEGGTPSVAAIYAATAGLQIVLEIGVDRLRSRQLELTADLVARAVEAGLRPRVPADLNLHAGIVTIPREDPAAVVRALREQRIIVDSRPGIVRVSPYFYNLSDDHQHAMEAFLALERRGVR
jgi:kynureninase